MLILTIALGVFLGILSWKVVKAGAKFFVYAMIAYGIILVLGFILQNILVITFCIIAVAYVVQAIQGAPSRRKYLPKEVEEAEEKGEGKENILSRRIRQQIETFKNIAAEHIGMIPSTAFWGYRSGLFPTDQKHYVVAESGNMLWLIEINPFTYESLSVSKVPISKAAIKIKKQLLNYKVAIDMDGSKLVLRTNKIGGEEAKKLAMITESRSVLS